jgi:hypothetical protein
VPWQTPLLEETRLNKFAAVGSRRNPKSRSSPLTAAARRPSLRHVTPFGFMRFLRAIFISRLLMGFFIEHDALAGLVFHIDLLRCG